MLEVANDEIQTLPMDHHGLVAAVCKDLRIAERIDACLGVHDKPIVSPCQSVVAMILNGLGFTNRRLYLTPQFFESKPVERLLDEAIQVKDLNDHSLNHLDTTSISVSGEYATSSTFPGRQRTRQYADLDGASGW